MRLGIVFAFLLAALPSAALAGSPRVHAYRPGNGVTVSDGGTYSLNLSGYVQPQVEIQRFLDDGRGGINQRLRLRRLRLRLSGRLRPARV